MLKCYLQNGVGGFDAPRLVSLDELTFPADGSPFLEDRVSATLLAECQDRRRLCFRYLKAIEKDTLTYAGAAGQREARALIEELRQVSPRLSIWDDEFIGEEEAVLRLVAVVFSMIEYARGAPKNYATRHPTIAGMLNTMLNGRPEIQRCALIIEQIIQRTPLADTLQKSVSAHLARAKEKMDGNLCLPGEPEWMVMGRLLPEVFDPVVREQLKYLGALPAWAGGSVARSPSRSD